MKIYKHRVVLPDGTVDTRTSETRCYRWAVASVVTESTRDVLVRRAERSLGAAKHKLAQLPVPTPEQDAEYDEIVRKDEEHQKKVGLGTPAERDNWFMVSRVLSHQKFSHPVFEYREAVGEVTRTEQGVHYAKTAELRDSVLGYSVTRENAEKRRSSYMEARGYVIKVFPVEVEEHETKARAKSVAGSTKNHKAVLAALPEVNVEASYEDAQKASGLTWRSFHRAFRELKEAGLVGYRHEQHKTFVVRTA